jgi:hypothetical protein
MLEYQQYQHAEEFTDLTDKLRSRFEIYDESE